MPNRFVLSHIRNLPLLAQMPLPLLEQISDAFEILQLPANQVVFRQGQPAQGLYLLVSGQAVLFSTTSGQERILGQVNENQYVGEAALFQNVTERMSMRVTRPSIVLFLARSRWQQLLLAQPAVRQHLSSQYTRLEASVPPAFPGQRPGEQMLLRTQRHPWWMARASLLPVLIGLALIVIAFALSATGLTPIILIAAVVFPGAWIYYIYIEWQNDFLVITDQRIIMTERTIITFQHSTQEVLISSLHEASYTIPAGDMFARLYGYGTVYIKTAGESGNMELPFMPNPAHIQDVLITAQRNYQRTSEQQNREAIGATIDRILNAGQPTAQTPAAAPQTKTTRKADAPGLFGTRFVDAQGNVVFRRHISVWLGYVLLPSLFILAGIGVFLFGLLFPNPGRAIELIAGPFIVLVGMVWFYWSDWDWRNDLLVVGDLTIRLIHRRPLWLQDVSQQLVLDQVDDAVVRRNGLLNTLLDRGDLSISLIGDDKPKVFTSLGEPDKVKNEIFARRAARQQRQQEAELERQREEIARYLDVYHERMRAMTPPAPTTPPPSNPPWPPVQPPAPPPTPGRQGQRPPRVPRARDDGSAR